MSSPEGVFCSCSSFLDVSSQGCGALAYFGSFPDSGQVCAVLADENGDLMLGGQPMGCTATCCSIAPGLVIIAGLRGFSLGSRSTWGGCNG